MGTLRYSSRKLGERTSRIMLRRHGQDQFVKPERGSRLTGDNADWFICDVQTTLAQGDHRIRSLRASN